MLVYKIYGILQGQSDIDYSLYLPRMVEPGTIGHINFYMWCIKGEDTTVLVDTGMTDEAAEKMVNGKYNGGVAYLEGKLKQLNIDPASVEKVIISHLHADHFSAYQLYPKATFYIQKKDIDFHTGPGVKFRQVAQFAADMTEVIGLAYAKRICYVDGDEQIVPGIRVVLMGGHTAGSQAVVVTTGLGQAVICADVVQIYRQLEEGVAGTSI
ncbi:MBL fold metallo-hydrolase, partial [Chloroflexota bacterium]